MNGFKTEKNMRALVQTNTTHTQHHTYRHAIYAYKCMHSRQTDRQTYMPYTDIHDRHIYMTDITT